MVLQVRLERVARDIKAYEMAAMLGYNPNLWLQVEKGRKKPPDDVARKASEILGRTVEELFQPAFTSSYRKGGMDAP